jgi:predicted glycosyl hydrolase (DUF1957 family)
VYAPICSRNGVAFFGRDSEATLPVWSAKDGYPGNPDYREFHRDLGWDLPVEQLAPLGPQRAPSAQLETAPGDQPQFTPESKGALTGQRWRPNG